jgi:hypothetical protein
MRAHLIGRATILTKPSGITATKGALTGHIETVDAFTGSSDETGHAEAVSAATDSSVERVATFTDPSVHSSVKSGQWESGLLEAATKPNHCREGGSGQHTRGVFGGIIFGVRVDFPSWRALSPKT